MSRNRNCTRAESPRTSHTLRGGVLMLALGAVLYGGWRTLLASQNNRLQERSANLPERLQSWEGEGGSADPSGIPGATPSSKV